MALAAGGLLVLCLAKGAVLGGRCLGRGLPDQFHVVGFAVAAGGVGLGATGYFAAQPPVGPLPFGGGASVAAHLLVMARAITLGRLGPGTIGGLAGGAQLLVLAFGGEPSVAAQLLVMARAVAGGRGPVDAVVGSADSGGVGHGGFFPVSGVQAADVVVQRRKGAKGDE